MMLRDTFKLDLKGGKKVKTKTATKEDLDYKTD